MQPHSGGKAFHITVGTKDNARRTTISIEKYLADALALKLGKQPGTTKAHSACRKWLQDRQNQLGPIPGPYLVKRALVFEVMAQELYRPWMKTVPM